MAIVAWDFLYYWDHRWMHEVRLFWANHVTHHSSQRYNLSTALRQPWSGFLLSWVYLPMPLLGIPAHSGGQGRPAQPAVPVLDPHRSDRPAPEADRGRVQHAVTPPGAPRRRPAVPRPQLRRRADRVGQAVRHVRARDPPRHLRPHEEHRHATTRYGSATTSSSTSAATWPRAKGLRSKLRHVFGRPGWTPTPLTGDRSAA